ncbi:hypothetical protein ACQP1K_13785 [Sphaerimonospora sp. CA-214678]|uniref:hypothetical protein n=1 Tax=Sphaerimonospora sp. CA-214678 TaxID=3240029 RepID=UPI003D8D552E
MEINVVDPVRRKGYRFRGLGEVHTEGELRESRTSGSWSASGAPAGHPPGPGEVRAGAGPVLETSQLISPAYEDPRAHTTSRGSRVAGASH